MNRDHFDGGVRNLQGRGKTALGAVTGSLQRGQSIVDVAISGGETISDLLSQMKEKMLAASDASLNARVDALSTPLTLVPGEKYIVSYLAPQGHYSYTSRYFQTAKTTGPLTAPAAGTGAAGNGLFAYGPNGGFPQATYGATNYFVDVSFTPTTP